MPLFFTDTDLIQCKADEQALGYSLQLHMVLVHMPFELLAVYRNSSVSWVPTAVIMLTEGTAGNHPQVVVFILVTWNDLL